MSKSREEALQESRRMGFAAGAATAATVALGAVGFPVVAVAAAVPSVWLVSRWWKHRAENGLRF